MEDKVLGEEVSGKNGAAQLFISKAREENASGGNERLFVL